MSNPPSWLKYDRKTLLFYAYFKEAVSESANEKFRVRKCNIYYYLSDGSIHVSEPLVENSGIPQVIFIKRHRIKGSSGAFLTERDFLKGDNVEIYGKLFHVVGCNSSTKKYLADICIDFDGPATEDFPEDVYTKKRAMVMQLETGADATVYRGVLMNPSKQHMEASLGKHMRESEFLYKYLKDDRKVLRFDCAWDDTKSMYGTLLKYTLHFFLSNDHIEILEKHTKNSGRDSWPLLLNRDLLPKNQTSGNDT